MITEQIRNKLSNDFERKFNETLNMSPDKDTTQVIEYSVIFNGALDIDFPVEFPGQEQYEWVAQWLYDDCKHDARNLEGADWTVYVTEYDSDHPADYLLKLRGSTAEQVR